MESLLTRDLTSPPAPPGFPSKEARKAFSQLDSFPPKVKPCGEPKIRGRNTLPSISPCPDKRDKTIMFLLLRKNHFLPKKNVLELGRLEEAKEKMASPILQSAFAKNVKLIHFVRSQGHFLRKTSQELRMLSRSPSDCRSLLLNLNLNLNRCLCSDCSDCRPTGRQCHLLSCPG